MPKMAQFEVDATRIEIACESHALWDASRMPFIIIIIIIVI